MAVTDFCCAVLIIIMTTVWHCWPINAVGVGTMTTFDIGSEPMVTVGLDYIAAPRFSYNSSAKDDPTHWFREYPDCEGLQQSPIDIKLEECEKSNKKWPIIFRNTHIRPDKVTLLNDRYTVKYLLNWGEKYPYVTGGELGRNRYIPRDIHFHWGDEDDRGSEHTVNGQKFSFEMHMVCFNEKYGSVADASNFLDGITVISQFFDVTRAEKRYFFMDIIHHVRKKRSKITMKSDLCRFALDNFIFVMPDEWEYVTYEGSFTTPPCYENVKWIVFLKTNPISKYQIKKFRDIEGLEGHIADNFRPTQEMNNRVCKINY